MTAQAGKHGPRELRALLPSLRGQWRPIVLAPVLTLLEVMTDIGVPFLMAVLIDDGIVAGDFGRVLQLGAILVGLCALAVVFGVLSGRYSAFAAAGVARNLRRDVFRAVQGFSFRSIDRFSTAGLVTRLTTDVANVQNATQMILRIAVRSPFTMIFALTMAFAVSPSISVIFLAIIPLLGAGLFLIMRFAFPLFTRVFATYDRLNTIVQENLHGIRAVKAFVRAEHEQERFTATSGTIRRDFVAAERLLAVNMPLMQIAIYASLLLIAWIGAHRIVGGELSTGQLVSLITYATQILMSLMMLSQVFVLVTMSRPSVSRIAQALVEPSDQPVPQAPTSPAGAAIEFREVDFSYTGEPERCALRDIELRIPEGATIGILGGTGSGKSTLVQLIPRLYDATAGTVLVGGVDVREQDAQRLRDTIAIVLQRNVLFAGTIAENLRWADADADEAELRWAAGIAQAEEFIATLPEGYDTLLEQGGANLSGGQRQRLCIARAVLKRPAILILDDSTSAVDTATERRIREALRRELPGTTKLIVAQRITSVADADQIIVLDAGRIDGIGTHEQLLASNAIYREVHESQTQGVLAG